MSQRAGTVYAWDQPKQQLYLKKVLAGSGLSQREFGPLVGVSPGLINLCCNKGYFPKKPPNFKELIEKALRQNPAAMKFLDSENKPLSAIWEPYNNEMTRVMPADHSRRCNENPLKPGDPLEVEPKEVAMLSPEAMKHFRLFRNPFIGDIRDEGDIYMSEEHRYINAAMMDAAVHGGLLAVIGEVGSGKTVMRRKIVEDFQRAGKVRIIYPKILEKKRISAGSIGDAIISDISSEKPTIRLEAKGRQVHRLLQARHREGYRHVLLIEEAHLLNIEALKFMKQLHEYEDGYAKMLGIVLIGQTELRDKLDEAQYPELRELIRRIQVANIRGLNGNLKEYLTFKFKRLKVDVEKIFDDSALEMMSRRMVDTDSSGRKYSTAVPLDVNNMAINAMNLAVEMGEDKVTAEVIQEL